ncbi:MarR family transcriptional regulator [Fusibacter bizertensis]|uniref:HTH-type transcriptional regulator SarZ n=1 Tax=Fusibacter bizertensis TaxID=1488331 RepID=A0ABT6NBG8_9FIRM|nr:MarR family transcriptional regulator [Fusibacter bizertensis]MDH8677762.1 MarR family transcriptional regulator [Fusibacter bizertensis]
MNSKKEVMNHLLVTLFNQILNIEEKALKKGPYNNLTINELHVIDAIGIDHVHPMSIIASKLDVTVGTLTIAMNNLVKKGYATRVRSEEDRRVVLVGLTTIGVEAYEHHREFHEDMITYTVSAMNDKESDVLIEALTKITEYFNNKYLD